MNFLNEFLNGAVNGFGMFTIMTILGFITFRVLKNWIVKTVSDIWQTARGQLEFSVKVQKQNLPKVIKMDGNSFDKS